MPIEETYEKVLAKKGDLKDTETGSSNTNNTIYTKVTKENLPTNRWIMHENIPTTGSKGLKYVNRKNTREKPNG